MNGPPWSVGGCAFTPVIEEPERDVWVHRLPDFLDSAAVRGLDTEIDTHGPDFARSAAAVPSTVRAPRLCLAFGDDAMAFADLEASRPWPTLLGRVRSRLSELAGHPFNYALANWYRDGQDYTGWHADKIAFHEPDSAVAIVSLGATRELVFRRPEDGTILGAAAMTAGSLLLMSYATHRWYEHSLPRSESAERRVSITYRHLHGGSVAG